MAGRMQGQTAGYVSLPGAWQQPSAVRKSIITINNTSLPAVPALCCLLYLAGLPMWAVGMLQARASVDAIFTDLGITADALDKVKASVLASVIVLSVLAIALLIANAWLETSSCKQQQQQTGLSLSTYTSHAFRLNVANWLLLLALALAMAGSIAWLSDMRTALAATEGAGGGYGYSVPHSSGGDTALVGSSSSSSKSRTGLASALSSAAAAGPAHVPQGMQAVLRAGAAATLAGGEADAKADAGALLVDRVGTFCPPGCIDLGVVAKLLGLPWPCFCSLGLLDDLVAQLHKVVKQLWVAVVGALLLFTATSWIFGYVAVQGALAARELQDIALGSAGGSGPLHGGFAAGPATAGAGP